MDMDSSSASAADRSTGGETANVNASGTSPVPYSRLDLSDSVLQAAIREGLKRDLSKQRATIALNPEAKPFEPKAKVDMDGVTDFMRTMKSDFEKKMEACVETLDKRERALEQKERAVDQKEQRLEAYLKVLEKREQAVGQLEQDLRDQQQLILEREGQTVTNNRQAIAAYKERNEDLEKDVEELKRKNEELKQKMKDNWSRLDNWDEELRQREADIDKREKELSKKAEFRNRIRLTSEQSIVGSPLKGTSEVGSVSPVGRSEVDKRLKNENELLQKTIEELQMQIKKQAGADAEMEEKCRRRQEYLEKQKEDLEIEKRFLSIGRDVLQEDICRHKALIMKVIDDFNRKSKAEDLALLKPLIKEMERFKLAKLEIMLPELKTMKKLIAQAKMEDDM